MNYRVNEMGWVSHQGILKNQLKGGNKMKLKVGILLTILALAISLVWMYLMSMGLMPNFGFGIKISAPMLIGGLVIFLIILSALFFSRRRKSS